MKRTPIDGSFPWERWASDAADIEQLDRRQAARLLFDTLAINRFEHALLELKNAGAVWGPVHTSVGQEATASAAVAALRPSDKMAATYRAHHQFLAKVLQAQVPADWDPAAGELPEQAQEVFYRTMAEIMGLAPGYCGGRGGSMHLRHNESGFLGIERDRGRRRAAGGRRRLCREVRRHRQRGGLLYRRRGGQSGRLSRGVQPGRPVVACR